MYLIYNIHELFNEFEMRMFVCNSDQSSILFPPLYSNMNLVIHFMLSTFYA